jgi:hypothetical protein
MDLLKSFKPSKLYPKLRSDENEKNDSDPFYNVRSRLPNA